MAARIKGWLIAVSMLAAALVAAFQKGRPQGFGRGVADRRRCPASTSEAGVAGSGAGGCGEKPNISAISAQDNLGANINNKYNIR